AVYPVSSSNSRIAVYSGASPGSSFPAGISTKDRSSALRYCSTKTILFSGVITMIATAPGCSINSRFDVWPFGRDTSSTFKLIIFPSYIRLEEIVFSSNFFIGILFSFVVSLRKSIPYKIRQTEGGAEMKKRFLGNSGIEVSEIGLGCMSLPTEKKEAGIIVDAAIAHGINY